MARAAFFDLDKTLVPGSSLFLLARGLYERDFYRARDIARLAWGQLVFQMAGRESRAGMEKSRNAALEFVKGRYADLKQASADRCARLLGTVVKPPEVQFHHEVYNQFLWNQF